MPTLEVTLNEPVYTALEQATRLYRQSADAIVQEALGCLFEGVATSGKRLQSYTFRDDMASSQDSR